MDRKLVLIFIGAILLRFILSIINVYVFPDILPHSGEDTKNFEMTGYYLATGKMDISTYRWDNYPRLIYIVYLIIGRMPAVIVAINGVVSILSAVYLHKILEIVIESRKRIFLLVSLFLFFPHNMIFASIILRESLIVYFVILSLYEFIKYSKLKKFNTIFLSVVYLLIATTLHAGVLFIGVGYLAYVLKDKQIIRKFDRYKKPLIIFLIVAIVGGLYLYSNLAFRKLASYDSLDAIINQVNKVSDNSGESAYLTSLKMTNLIDIIIFLPIKMFYLMFSPMLWDIRNINDIIAFLLDSFIYMYLTVGILNKIKKIHLKNDKNKLFIFLLVGLLATVSVFALGTSNAGTALRHRFKVLPLMIILANYPTARKKKKRYKKNDEEGETNGI
jgi:hypothetical protein